MAIRNELSAIQKKKGSAGQADAFDRTNSQAKMNPHHWQSFETRALRRTLEWQQRRPVLSFEYCFFRSERCRKRRNGRG